MFWNHMASVGKNLSNGTVETANICLPHRRPSDVRSPLFPGPIENRFPVLIWPIFSIVRSKAQLKVCDETETRGKAVGARIQRRDEHRVENGRVTPPGLPQAVD